jgi:hypothetical protein
MTILKPTGMIISRQEVERLAAAHPDVTELDLSEANIIGGSAMHQMIASFAGATFTGMDDWTKEQYGWVMKILDDITPPDVSLLRAAAEDAGCETPDTQQHPRRNRGYILAGLGLVRSEAFERDHLAWLRFRITRLGQNVLKKKE